MEQCHRERFSEALTSAHRASFGPATVTTAQAEARIGRFAATDESFQMLVAEYVMSQERARQIGCCFRPGFGRTSPDGFLAGEGRAGGVSRAAASRTHASRDKDLGWERS